MMVQWPNAHGALSEGVFLLAFFVYAFLMLLGNRSIDRRGGIACGIFGIIFTLQFIRSGVAGPRVFILACLALVVGVVTYQPAHSKQR